MQNLARLHEAECTFSAYGGRVAAGIFAFVSLPCFVQAARFTGPPALEEARSRVDRHYAGFFFLSSNLCGAESERGIELDASTADHRATRCWAPGLNVLAFCTPKLDLACAVLM